MLSFCFFRKRLRCTSTKFSSARTRTVWFRSRLSQNVFRNLWSSCEFDSIDNGSGLLRPGAHSVGVEGARPHDLRLRVHGRRLHRKFVPSSLHGHLQRPGGLRGWLCVHYLPHIRCGEGKTDLFVSTRKTEKLSEDNFQLKPFPVLCWVALSSYHLIDFILIFTPFYGHDYALSDLPLFSWLDICKNSFNFRPF